MGFLIFFKLLLGGSVRAKVNNINFVDKRYPSFTEFYNREIKPHADQAERERVGSLNKIIARSRLFLPVILFMIIGGFKTYLIAYSYIEHYLFMSGLILVAYGVWVFSMIRKFKNSIKNKFFTKVMKFLGSFAYYPDGHSFNIKHLEKFDIIPNYNEIWVEDAIIGNYKGVELHFEEMCLKKVVYDSKGRRSEYTVFKGVIVLLSFNKNFNGQTVLRKDGGKIGNFFGNIGSKFSKMKKVNLEDPEFEKMFEVYSTDQIEARYILTTSFMERIKRLKNFFHSKKFEASFCDNELLLMFTSNYNFFAVSSILKPVNLVKESKTVLEQMSLIFDTIDTLKLNERLVGENDKKSKVSAAHTLWS